MPSRSGITRINKKVRSISPGLGSIAFKSGCVAGTKWAARINMVGVRMIELNDTTAEIETESAAFPFATVVNKLDMFPPGHAETNTNPKATLAGRGGDQR